MAIIEIIINSKVYQIVCEDDNDSIKIKEYAEELNKKINEIKNQSPDLFLGLNNETLLIFSALSFIEDLFSANELLLNNDKLDNLSAISSRIKKNLDKITKNVIE
jgi:cell division protein ZapA (FtsZ GTPase activity inhibitor)